MGEWKPIFLSLRGPLLSHLMFADNVTPFSKAELNQIAVIKDCLDWFCTVVGQKVSLSKSIIHYSSNVSSTLAGSLTASLGFQATRQPGKYLGMPAINKRFSKATYTVVIDRVQSKLQGWKAHYLSFAGRVTLVKSVTSAIFSYGMQTTIFQKSV